MSISRMFEFIAEFPNIREIGKKEKRKIVIFSLRYVFLDFPKLILSILIEAINISFSLLLIHYI